MVQFNRSEAIQFSGSSVALNANVTTANADITFVPAVTVGADVTIDSGAGVGDITFSSTLDGGQAVVLDAGSGGINFNGVVGATALTSLATTGTTGSISIGQNVTTTGVQTFTGPVTLSGSPTLTTTDSLVTFSGDVSGAGALTVTSGTGGLTFGSTIGAGVNVTSLSTTGTTGNITLSGDIDSDGTLSFTGPVCWLQMLPLQHLMTWLASLSFEQCSKSCCYNWFGRSYILGNSWWQYTAN